jgi:hypothetical protein
VARQLTTQAKQLLPVPDAGTVLIVLALVLAELAAKSFLCLFAAAPPHCAGEVRLVHAA